MNGAKAFFDTNVLLYMYGGEAGKRARAKALYREHALSGRVLLSTQVVQEFYAAGSRKLGIPRPELREAAAPRRRRIEDVAEHPPDVLQGRRVTVTGHRARHLSICT